MKYYFFNSAPTPLAVSFDKESVTQNLSSVWICAWCNLCIASLILGSHLFVDYSKLLTNEAFYHTVTLSNFFLSVAGIAGVYLIRKQENLSNNVIRYFNLGYAFLFILMCMAISFGSQYSPRTNMSVYLLGALCVAIAWSLSLWEVLLLMLCTSTAFTIALQNSTFENEQLLLHSFTSVFIITGFFLLSRMIYSYRINHHIQLHNIEEQKREIEKISKAKSEILGVVAHDLRSPIANIEMLVSLINRNHLTPEQQKQYLEMVLTCCHKSRNIINDLVELARIEQEKDFPLEKTELNSFLQEVQAVWQAQIIDSKQLELTLTSAPLFVNLNKEKFQRVLDNLITNAVKFTRENGLIHVSVSQKGQDVLLRISDNGIGVPQKLKPHLFKPFTKAGRNGLNGEASTGLGLSISRKLVEQHHGTIDLESEENKGTTFLIKLPALAGK